MKSNSQIRREARKNLSGFAYDGQPLSGSYPESKWGTFVIMTFLYMLISSVAQTPMNIGEVLMENDSFFSIAATLTFISIGLIFLCVPMSWGYSVSFLEHHRKQPVDIDRLFAGYRQFGRIFVAYLLIFVYTFLWTLLFIIPGIVKSYSYAMAPYILTDHPELSGEQAICRSMAMMQGNKLRLFLLHLSFIGWAILATLTCGIGFLWLYPYIYASMAVFYEDVKKDFEEKYATTEA